MDIFNIIAVFVSGVFTFVSPCILPLFPVYLTVLSQSKHGESKKSLIINTILFMVGISTSFFILGLGMSTLSLFINKSEQLILSVGGLLIVFMGLFYMGYLKLPFLERTFKINTEVKEMKPWSAYFLGFTFSFGWTPCIGPMLTSVLIMASTQDTLVQGNILILIYSLGFMVPFLLMAIFSKYVFKIFDKLKVHMESIKQFAGLFLVVTGIVMLLGGSANVRTKINGFVDQVLNSGSAVVEDQNKDQEEVKENDESENNADEDEVYKPAATNFSLQDQNGITHKLSDYKGKTIVLNFYATWCPYCKQLLPDLEELYSEYGSNKKDVVFLSVVTPNLGKEKDSDYILNFINENNYTYPMLFDQNQKLVEDYYIQSYPTTFIINKEGNIEGYIPGALEKDDLKSIIDNYK